MEDRGLDDRQIVYITSMLKQLVGALERSSDWDDSHADLCNDSYDLIDLLSSYAEEYDVDELDFNTD